MSRNRGITLVELLATLSILAVFTVISVSWMSVVLRSQSDIAAEATWKRASLEVLDLIGQDVMVVDRLDTGGRLRPPRISVDQGVLYIRTRTHGEPVVWEYILDSEAQNFDRQRKGERGQKSLLPLLGDTEKFECSLVLPTDEVLVPYLYVMLESNDGRVVHRSFFLDREDVQ